MQEENKDINKQKCIKVYYQLLWLVEWVRDIIEIIKNGTNVIMDMLEIEPDKRI